MIRLLFIFLLPIVIISLPFVFIYNIAINKDIDNAIGWCNLIMQCVIYVIINNKI